MDLSVCLCASVCVSLSVNISPLERLKTISRTQRATKVKKFVGSSLKLFRCRDPALTLSYGHMYRITKNFRGKKLLRKTLQQRCAKGRSVNRLVYVTGNFAKKLSRYSKSREICESFLSQKFLVIRYIQAAIFHAHVVILMSMRTPAHTRIALIRITGSHAHAGAEGLHFSAHLWPVLLIRANVEILYMFKFSFLVTPDSRKHL